jgi:hypothetical protein
VDFAVAGKPTSEGTHVSVKTPLPAKKHGKPHTKPGSKVGPAPKRKGAKEKPKRQKRK